MSFSTSLRRSKRLLCLAEPDANEQKRFCTMIEQVEVVSFAYAKVNTPPESLELRFWPTDKNEIEDRMPMPTKADQERYRGWAIAMAKRLHEAVDGVNRSTPVRVNCEMGQARSPTIVLAWLRLYHSLHVEHLDWALHALEMHNKTLGHKQSMKGSLERFRDLLESL
jgi:hypothetical protein